MAAKAKLDDILFAMESPTDEMALYINRETGELVSIALDTMHLVEEEVENEDFDEDSFKALPDWELDDLDTIRDVVKNEGSKYIPVPTQFDIHEWEIMRQFCFTLDDEDVSQALLNAIHGSGAFRYFKDSIHRFGIADEWYKFRENALKEIAIEWCEEHVIEYI